jgi:hypothetical protein
MERGRIICKVCCTDRLKCLDTWSTAKVCSGCSGPREPYTGRIADGRIYCAACSDDYALYASGIPREDGAGTAGYSLSGDGAGEAGEAGGDDGTDTEGEAGASGDEEAQLSCPAGDGECEWTDGHAAWECARCGSSNTSHNGCTFEERPYCNTCTCACGELPLPRDGYAPWQRHETRDGNQLECCDRCHNH